MDTLKRLAVSRKVWVALSGFLGCIVIVMGADPAKWTPLIAALVTLATAVIGGIAFEDGNEKSATEPEPELDVIHLKPKAGQSPPTPSPSLLLAIAAGLLVLLAGCSSSSMSSGERETFDAVAPEYEGYVAADPSLDAEQKARRERTVATWRLRVGAQEAATQPTE